MAKSSSLSSSISSASKAASAAISASAKSAASAASSASAKASAAARDAAGHPASSSKLYTGLTVTAVIITVLALAVAGVYFSGYADDFFLYYVKKYYKAKAMAEVTALENVGEGQAKGFLKDQLKKNPVMGEDELEQVSSGLGKEASLQGLGGVSSKLGGLGKL